MNFIDTSFDIDQALIEWKAEKIAKKFYAKWDAGESTDADAAEYHNRYNIARAEVKATEVKATEVKATAETTAQTATEVIANINTNEAFGTAWGADGQVLSYAETVEAIAKRDGWFDTQGRWVNKAGWEKQHAHLSAWVIAKLTAN
jgi:hypothetical protein